jgi:hypothetical protein
VRDLPRSYGCSLSDRANFGQAGVAMWLFRLNAAQVCFVPISN